MEVKHYNRNFVAEDICDLVGTRPFIIEIGSNDGKDTASFLEAMPEVYICCFEFDVRAIEDFHARNLGPRVTLHEIGISDRTETRKSWLSGGIPDCNNPKKEWHKSNSIEEPREHKKKSPEITFTKGPLIQCHPLDYFWDEYQLPVDFLWCDCQGAEPEVILGGQRTLRQTRYAIFEFYDAEVYARQADVRGLRSFLRDFEVMGIYGENVLFKNERL